MQLGHVHVCEALDSRLSLTQWFGQEVNWWRPDMTNRVITKPMLTRGIKLDSILGCRSAEPRWASAISLPYGRCVNRDHAMIEMSHLMSAGCNSCQQTKM